MKHSTHALGHAPVTNTSAHGSRKIATSRPEQAASHAAGPPSMLHALAPHCVRHGWTTSRLRPECLGRARACQGGDFATFLRKVRNIAVVTAASGHPRRQPACLARVRVLQDVLEDALGLVPDGTLKWSTFEKHNSKTFKNAFWKCSADFLQMYQNV